MYLSNYREKLLRAPSYKSEYCAVCGLPATNQHHVVPGCRKATKHNPESPTISLCGFGNASGCHGMAHKGYLHFRYEEGWEYLFTPTSVSEDAAQDMDGWVRM